MIVGYEVARQLGVDGIFTERVDGEFAGLPPTNKTFEVPIVVIYEIENGKIVNHWLLADNMGVMQQLGAIPAQA